MARAEGAAAEPFDLAVVGAGAAGLMASIQAGRASRELGARPRIVALDGARHLGAKILVAGGGRCNVTHRAVDEKVFSGSTPPAIRKVLRRFDVSETVDFFARLGVVLKTEETGKLFPVTDRARTVLDALVRAAAAAGVEIVNPWRVASVAASPEGFALAGPAGRLRARRVILAAGGKSLPKSGSDGHGYAIARSLGHSTTARILPALVPLELAAGSFVRRIPGVAVPARLTVRSSAGRLLAGTEGPVLCTHAGLSGPAVLDVSRHLLHATADDAGAHLVIGWLPELAPPPGRPIGGWLRGALPERLADALVAEAGVDPGLPWDRQPREARRRLAEVVTAWRAPVTGDLGFAKAEVTAGGVPLDEIRLDTMGSRRKEGLHLCGEILDVDGRIGGFNFQWAWASGFVAGRGAAAALYSSRSGGRTPEASR